jgi:hypothetical protein
LLYSQDFPSRHHFWSLATYFVQLELHFGTHWYRFRLHYSDIYIFLNITEISSHDLPWEHVMVPSRKKHVLVRLYCIDQQGIYLDGLLAILQLKVHEVGCQTSFYLRNNSRATFPCLLHQKFERPHWSQKRWVELDVQIQWYFAWWDACHLPKSKKEFLGELMQIERVRSGCIIVQC